MIDNHSDHEEEVVARREITLRRITLSTLVVLLPFAAIILFAYHDKRNKYDDDHDVVNSKMKAYDSSLYRNHRQLPRLQQLQQRRLQGLLIPWLEAFGGNPPPSNLPLQVCQGDCDSDFDCAPGLYCYQRESNQPVPGCQGGETFVAKTDFCIIINNDQNNNNNNNNEPPEDDDDEEEGSTYNPTFPPTVSPSASPTITPGVVMTDPPSTAVPTPFPTTIQPSTTTPTSPTIITTYVSTPPPPQQQQQQQQPSLPPDDIVDDGGDDVLVAEYVADNGSPESVFPLQQCQADCDSDSDCGWGLYCYARDFDDDPIPGCSTTTVMNPLGDDDTTITAIISRQGGGLMNNDIGNKDFCLRSPSILPGAFRLKLYWEEGYVWQDSTEESFWCATTHFDGYPGTGNCWYGEETQECTTNHTYLARCDGTGLSPSQQAWRFLRVNNNINNNEEEKEEEVLIQSAAIYDRRCWERYKREVFLNVCDPTNEKQRWIASDGTSFFDEEENRFEISQIDYGKQCVSNDHHPKPGEVVELHSCVALRKNSSQTAYWSKY